MNSEHPRDASTSRQKSWRPAAAEDISVYAVRRYALHAEIGSGSVATVHLGRLLGPESFARTVAVKRLRRQYAKDAECVAMLLDGARLAAGVRHPNVVPTLDVVTGDEILVVTEYVHGESLATLLRTLRGRGAQVPLPIVSGIVAGMLRGLQAVHERRDARTAAGDRVGRRHRGVARRVVGVGADGVARLIDIGVGRDAEPASSVPSGADPTDGNADGDHDVFCASLILWEALAGRPLLPRISPDGFEPPSRYRPDLAPEVDAIVAKGHASAPGARFATAGEMALALEAALPAATPSQIGAWVESLAGAALEERAAWLAGIEALSALPATSSVRPPADTLPAPASVPPAPRVEPVTRRERASAPPFGTTRGLGPPADAAMVDAAPAAGTAVDDANAYAAALGSRRRRRGMILAASIASAALAVVVGTRFAGGDHAPVPAGTTPAASARDTVAEPPPATSRPVDPAAPSEPEGPRTQTPAAAPSGPASKASKAHRAPRPRRDDVL